MRVSEQLESLEHPNRENLLPFEILYERYHSRIYRYLRAHLRNDEDAADLAQQVLFQIWMKIGTYQPERGSLTAWVFRIAHHRLVDSYRAARSAIAWEPLGEITITHHDPEEMVIAAETLAWVQTLLDALSDEERELLALRFAARLQLSEIAAVIGKSAEATRKQLARLLQRLRRHYQQYQQQDLGTCGAKGEDVPSHLCWQSSFRSLLLPPSTWFCAACPSHCCGGVVKNRLLPEKKGKTNHGCIAVRYQSFPHVLCPGRLHALGRHL